MAVVQDDDDASGKSDYKSRRLDIPDTVKEQLCDPVGGVTHRYTRGKAHDKKERGNLHDVPSVSHYAGNEKKDGEKKYFNDKIMNGLPKCHPPGKPEEDCQDRQGRQIHCSLAEGHSGFRVKP